MTVHQALTEDVVKTATRLEVNPEAGKEAMPRLDAELVAKHAPERRPSKKSTPIPTAVKTRTAREAVVWYRDKMIEENVQYPITHDFFDDEFPWCLADGSFHATPDHYTSSEDSDAAE